MRYYVAPNGTGNASSWASAGDLQNTLALILASPSRGGDEIWAAGDNNVLGATHQGQYNLTAPLVINNNTEPLSIYGGFVGREAYLCQRNANIVSNDPANVPDFFQNPSILDGGNTNRVIEMSQANVFLIDGFVIQNGNAGTGLSDGGGVHANGQNLRFENLVIMDNTAGRNGGGMYTAAMLNLMIKNTIFFNNQATNNGGGIWIGDGDNQILVNVLFNNNQTNGGNGNAIFVTPDPYNVKIINNTIAGNTGSSASTPSVYCDRPLHVDIYNSIIYPDILAATGGTPFANVRVDYCLLSNLIPFAILQNPNGINPPLPPAPPVNPLFVNQASLSAGGDYHLQPTSPCIDEGSTNLIFPLSATDLEGKPRFIDKGMGTPPSFPTIKVIDMGAFEVQ